MKRMIAMMMMAGCSLMAADLRTVSGIAVDVEPAMTWEMAKGQKGERPLPHWKLVTVLAYGGQANGAHLARVSIKGEGEREVLLTGVAQDLAQKMTRHRDTALALARLNAEIDRAERAQGGHSPTQSQAYFTSAHKNRVLLQRLLDEAKVDLVKATDVAMWTSREIAGRQLWTFGKR